MVPEVTDSRPARMRNSVVLPHPPGPTIMKNAPGAMSTETPSIAMSCPNILRRSRMRMAGRVGSGSAASSLASGRVMDGPGRLQFAERSPHSQPVIFAPICRGPRPLLEAGANVERRAATMKPSIDRIPTTPLASLIAPHPHHLGGQPAPAPAAAGVAAREAGGNTVRLDRLRDVPDPVGRRYRPPAGRGRHRRDQRRRIREIDQLVAIRARTLERLRTPSGQAGCQSISARR